LLRSLAGELQRFDGRLCDLLEESDPRTTVEALEDWERVLGLPDACFGSGGTVDERRRIVVALLLMQGGQSAAYFVSLAALFGWEIAVEEVFPGLQMDISHFGECEFAVDWSGFDLGPACFGDAALFGESAAPFGWWAYGPATEASRWEFGSTNFGDAFLDFSNRILECLLARFKPAHTRVWTVLNATDVVAALET
jgi:uncharacterized protein YmfQ (DUF2313 family)